MIVYYELECSRDEPERAAWHPHDRLWKRPRARGTLTARGVRVGTSGNSTKADSCFRGVNFPCKVHRTCLHPGFLAVCLPATRTGCPFGSERGGGSFRQTPKYAPACDHAHRFERLHVMPQCTSGNLDEAFRRFASRFEVVHNMIQSDTAHPRPS